MVASESGNLTIIKALNGIITILDKTMSENKNYANHY